MTILLDFSFLEEKKKRRKNDKMISLVPALDYFYVSFFIDLSYLNNALLSSLFFLFSSHSSCPIIITTKYDHYYSLIKRAFVLFPSRRAPSFIFSLLYYSLSLSFSFSHFFFSNESTSLSSKGNFDHLRR